MSLKLVAAPDCRIRLLKGDEELPRGQSRVLPQLRVTGLPGGGRPRDLGVMAIPLLVAQVKGGHTPVWGGAGEADGVALVRQTWRVVQEMVDGGSGGGARVLGLSSSQAPVVLRLCDQ